MIRSIGCTLHYDKLAPAVREHPEAVAHQEVPQ